ncbi:hypothetical protein DL96DRAFT_1805576 [Flagelloscypha sp. PMI_526]|nr:hypothetical protein DL96DRAFT_1805576 [Flagelloscypha sp. PMI_526]
MAPATILNIPPDILSCVFDYFPYIYHPHTRTFGNDTLRTGMMVNRQFAAAARPKLWAYVVLPTDSLNPLKALCAIVASSREVRCWVRKIHITWRQVGWRYKEEEAGNKTLAALIRVLPAVKTLILEGARMHGSGGREVIPGFHSYPTCVQEALFESTFPGLISLYVVHLHSVPFSEILRLCPDLKILDITQHSIDPWPEANRMPSPFPAIASQDVSCHPLRRLSLHGSKLAELLDGTSGYSPLPAIQSLGVQLTHLTLFGWVRTTNLTVWSEAIHRLGPTLESLAFTLDKEFCQITMIPGMELLDLARLPRLRTLEIAFLGGTFSALEVNNSMEEVAALIATSTTLKNLRFHLIYENIELDSSLTLCWKALDVVLCRNGVDVKVSVSRSHYFPLPSNFTYPRVVSLSPDTDLSRDEL